MGEQTLASERLADPGAEEGIEQRHGQVVGDVGVSPGPTPQGQHQIPAVVVTSSNETGDVNGGIVTQVAVDKEQVGVPLDSVFDEQLDVASFAGGAGWRAEDTLGDPTMPRHEAAERVVVAVLVGQHQLHGGDLAEQRRPVFDCLSQGDDGGRFVTDRDTDHEMPHPPPFGNGLSQVVVRFAAWPGPSCYRRTEWRSPVGHGPGSADRARARR